MNAGAGLLHRNTRAEDQGVILRMFKFRVVSNHSSDTARYGSHDDYYPVNGGEDMF